MDDRELLCLRAFVQFISRHAANAVKKRSIVMKPNRMSITVLAIAFPLMFGVSVYAAEVKANWDKQCAKCHGADGKGQTKMGQKAGAKDYTDPKVQATIKDDQAFNAIKNGLKDKD